MERIFYKSDSLDPHTDLPIFIFDTSYLPSTDLINYDAFIPTMMKYLPLEPYALVMFNCGLNKILWVWGIKFLKEFLDNEKYDNLSNLIKIYTVHDSWFVKSITQIFNTKKNIQSLQRMMDNFSLSNGLDSIALKSSSASNVSKIIRCGNLSELSKFVDITKLKISLNIYKHNLLDNDGIGQSVPSGVPTLSHESFRHHFYQIFNILNNNADKVELIFHKPGNKLNTDVLFQCINRNQRVWINDWDLWCIGATFKKILTELPEPIISLESIELPIQDTLVYTRTNLKKVWRQSTLDSSQLILFQFIELCQKVLDNCEITKHTAASLAKSVSHCLSHEMILLNKDRISIVNRFLKNVFDHWSDIRPEFAGSYPSVDTVIGRKEEETGSAQTFNSYDISYDLTIDNDEEDLEYRVAFNTTNILSDDKNLKRNDTDKPKQGSQRKTENFELDTPEKPPIKKRSLFSPAKVSPPNFVFNEKSEPTGDKPSRPSSQVSIHTASKSINSISGIGAATGPGYTTPKSSHSASRSVSSIGSLSTIVPSPLASPTSSIANVGQKLNKQPTLKDVSNITVQYPPQKYKFQKLVPAIQTSLQQNKQLENVKSNQSPVKKPVIRGRKVGELARLFEERAEALEVLRTM